MTLTTPLVDAATHSSRDDSSIVDVEDVSRIFPGPAKASRVVALGGVTLRVRRGEFLALLGPSGCGKTTLLRIIGGLDSPTSGSVRIDGHDMAGVPPEKRPVNMMFQTPALFPHMAVFDNIAFGPRMAGVPRDQFAPRVNEVLSLVRLEGYEQRSVTQLSGGQAQRVAMARALINRPKVLLLDEPLAALDLKLRKELQLELKSIHRVLGTTFIYVTHDQEEAITMADRIVIMNDGLLVQDGSPFEIYDHPSSVFASQFIGESNVFKGTVSRVDGREVRVDVDGKTVESSDGSGVAIGQTVWVSIRPEKMSIKRWDVPGQPAGAWRGDVVDAVFQGAFVKYRVQMPSGPLLTAVDTVTDPQAILAAGAPVALSWGVDSVRLLTS